MKRCTCCGIDKPLMAFCKDRHRSDGLKCWCRECSAAKQRAIPHGRMQEYQKRWRAKNVEKVRASNRARYVRDPARAKKIQDRYRQKYPERVAARRRTMRLAIYGLTPADYDARLAAQSGVCAVCHSMDPQHWSGRFQVDHDHATGVVRGLLCAPCNGGLGLLNDDPKRLVAALSYLMAKLDISAKIAAVGELGELRS